MSNLLKQGQATIWIAFIALLCLVESLYFYRSSPQVNDLPISDTPTSTSVAAQLLQLPLRFESNEGQTEASVQYLTRGKGYTLYFTPQEIVMVLQKKLEGADQFSSSVLKMQFVGAKTDPFVQGLEEQASKSHYYIGNDPTNWHTNISNYAKVSYQDLYPGIDAVFYGNSQQLEYDILVAPHHNPQQAVLHIEGAKELSIDQSGNLHMLTADYEDVYMQKPFVYQIKDGEKITIEGQFVLLAQNDVGFAIGAYDTNKLLVIDPFLSYSTYLGGSGTDSGTSIAVDSAGNVYVTGSTSSSLDFPTTAGAEQLSYGGGVSDAFVTKLNSSGSSLIYSTYLGGNSNDFGTSIAVDSSGNAYITGSTGSTNFPTTTGSLQTTYGGGNSDGFVTKLDPTGSTLTYSTYLGGSSSDFGSGIAVDSTGSAYITGQTDSTDFHTTTGAFQTSINGGGLVFNAFITKLAPTGSTLAYSTYLGGTGSVGIGDFGTSIAIDSTGNAYITGSTSSMDFPTTLGAFQTTYGLGGSSDAFITKLNPAGSTLIYSTYLGVSDANIGSGIAVDSAGNAYITGSTSSANFPTLNPFQGMYGGGTSDAFVTKLNPSGSALVYSTYLGGSDIDMGNSIAIDSTGNAYVTGETNSTDFPTHNAIQSINIGGLSVFITKLDSAGSSLIYSTYLGGCGDDLGFGIAVDSTDNAYVTGSTTSLNFPTANPLYPTNAGGSDAFILKIVDVPIVTGISPKQGPASGGTVVTISGANFTGATTVSFGGGNPAVFAFNSDNQMTAVSPAGVGTVDITVTTPSGTSTITPADQFTYIPIPVVTGISPNQGPESGGTPVIITGTGFTGASAVSFGVTPTAFLVNNDNQITAFSPPGVGAVDVTVTNPISGTSEATPADQFTYIPTPVISAAVVTGISPTSGPEAGGTVVTITGTNFTGATAVSFGGTPTAFLVNSNNQITAVSPPGVSIVDITIITPSGTSAATPADQFTYTSTPVPPPPPVPFLLPPEHVRGKQIKNQFATQTEITNVITWHAPSSGQIPAVYKIFRNAALTELIDVVSANQNRLEFIDHNRQENHTYNYFIVSVDAAGNQSIAVHVKVNPK